MTDTIFSQALDTDNGTQDGLTCVHRWELAALTLPARSIRRIRFTFQSASAEALTITNAYVGQAAAAGDAYDFSTTPKQITFDGGSTSKAIAINSNAVSDWISFDYSGLSALLCSHYLGGGTSVDGPKQKSGVSNVTFYYKTANDAATVDKTGYNSVAGLLRGINKIEVETTGGIIAMY